jgi:peptidyl-prolyl cis-trans isomerase C
MRRVPLPDVTDVSSLTILCRSPRVSTLCAIAVLAMACSGNGAHKSPAQRSQSSAQTQPSQQAAQHAAQAHPAQTYGLTPEQAAQVLAEVGSEKLTLGEFAQLLGRQSAYVRARYRDPQRKREFLDNWVQFELLAQEAEQRGLLRSGDVARVGKQVMVQRMLQDLFDREGQPPSITDVSEAEIQRYYDEHYSDFHKPAQVRASHILFKDRALAERCHQQLLDAATPTDDALFHKLAQTYNQDPQTRSSAGDLRFFSRTPDPAGETASPERPAAVRAAAFSLRNLGDIAPQLVRSPQGFHIVRLTGRREALDRSLEDTQRILRNKLWRQKREKAREDFVADLRAKADVRENSEVLAEVQARHNAGGKSPHTRLPNKPADRGRSGQPTPKVP